MYEILALLFILLLFVALSDKKCSKCNGELYTYTGNIHVGQKPSGKKPPKK